VAEVEAAGAAVVEAGMCLLGTCMCLHYKDRLLHIHVASTTATATWAYDLPPGI